MVKFLTKNGLPVSEICNAIPSAGIKVIERLARGGYLTPYDFKKSQPNNGRLLGSTDYPASPISKMDYHQSTNILKKLNAYGIIETKRTEPFSKNPALKVKHYGFTSVGFLIALYIQTKFFGVKNNCLEWKDFMRGLKKTYEKQFPKCLSLYDENLDCEKDILTMRHLAFVLSYFAGEIYVSHTRDMSDRELDNFLYKTTLEHHVDVYLHLNDFEYKQLVLQQIRTNKESAMEVLKEMITEYENGLESLRKFRQELSAN